MKSRRLIKKYKNKSRSRRRKTRRSSRNIKRKYKSRGRKRVLKGGAFEQEKTTFIKNFFDNILKNWFPQALYALHTFYMSGISPGGISPDEINEFLCSDYFKNVYDDVFYTNVQIPTIGGGVQTNVEPTETLIFFQSYLFKIIAEGREIHFDNGLVLYFTPGPNSFLIILKEFFCYLDTACVLTISYQISQATFNIIDNSKYKTTRNKHDRPPGVTNGQLALYDLVTNLELLGSYSRSITRSGQSEPAFPGIVALLEQMTRGDGDGRIYSFNPQNLCTLIKMTLKDFT
jgi:hypothetical protein